MGEPTWRWSLNCAAAGTAAAILTGILGGLVVWVWTAVTVKDLDVSFAAGSGNLIWSLAVGALIGGAWGTPWGVLTMCLSRAGQAPWRSLPILLAGTTIGLLLSLCFWLLPQTTVTAVVMLAAPILGPTVGGIIATKFLPTQPRIHTRELPGSFVWGFLMGLIGGSGLLVGLIGPLLSTTAFANLSWNVPNQQLILVSWWAAHPVLGIIALVAAVSKIGVRKTVWTGFGGGLASSLFVTCAVYLFAFSQV